MFGYLLMLSMGHKIVWLARYEGLKVILRTVIFNLFHVSLNAHPRSCGIVLRSGYALSVFHENITRGRTQIFPFLMVPNYMILLLGGFNSP